jgi:phosphatidylglycerophosphatase C
LVTKLKNKWIVIFDLDKTITKIDTYIPFLLLVLLSRPYRLIFTFSLPFYFLLYSCKIISDTDLKLKFLKSIVSGIDEKKLHNLALKFVRVCYLFIFRKKAIKIINHHREKDAILILASASFDFYVVPIANALKFDYVVSTQSCWSKTGKLVTGINGSNLKGESKLSAVKEILSDGINKNNTITYTDHISDLPLLKYANQAYIVNPNSHMENVAKDNGFSVVFW